MKKILLLFLALMLAISSACFASDTDFFLDPSGIHEDEDDEEEVSIREFINFMNPEGIDLVDVVSILQSRYVNFNGLYNIEQNDPEYKLKLAAVAYGFIGVQYNYGQYMMNAYPELDDGVKRYKATQVLFVMKHKNEENPELDNYVNEPIYDVNQDSYDSKFVQYAVYNGWMSVNEAGLFKPLDNLSLTDINCKKFDATETVYSTYVTYADMIELLEPNYMNIYYDIDFTKATKGSKVYQLIASGIENDVFNESILEEDVAYIVDELSKIMNRHFAAYLLTNKYFSDNPNAKKALDKYDRYGNIDDEPVFNVYKEIMYAIDSGIMPKDENGLFHPNEPLKIDDVNWEILD